MDQNTGTTRTTSPGTGKIAAKSHEAAEQWKEAVVDQAHQVREKADEAKRQTSERIRGVATQFRNMSNTLRDDDPTVADLADRASNGVEAVARYVSSANVQSVIRDTERLARRQPALFFGGAFLLGLAAGRFLKGSSPAGSTRSEEGTHPHESEGYRLASRQDRASGFFPTGGAQSDGSRRPEDNRDSSLARGKGEPLARTPGDSPITGNSLRDPVTPRSTRDTARGIDPSGTLPGAGVTNAGTRAVPPGSGTGKGPQT